MPRAHGVPLKQLIVSSPDAEWPATFFAIKSTGKLHRPLLSRRLILCSARSTSKTDSLSGTGQLTGPPSFLSKQASTVSAKSRLSRLSVLRRSWRICWMYSNPLFLARCGVAAQYSSIAFSASEMPFGSPAVIRWRRVSRQVSMCVIVPRAYLARRVCCAPSCHERTSGKLLPSRGTTPAAERILSAGPPQVETSPGYGLRHQSCHPST